MRILICDTETNGLTPDTVWCVVLKEYKKEEYFVFINNHYLTNDLAEQLCKHTGVTIQPLSNFKGFTNELKMDSTVRLCGHNVLDFDFFVWNKLLGVDVFSFGISLRDTYVLSRLAYPKRPQGHSVEAWGNRFGLTKTQIQDEQWSKFDPVMIERCITDTQIQERIYEHLREKELLGFSLESIELEHEVQKIISQQRREGVYVDPQKVHTLYATCKYRADHMEREIQSVFPPRSKLIREYNPKITKDGIYAKNTLGPGAKDTESNIVSGPYSYITFEPFNPSSPSQRVVRLLELGWVPTEFTKPSETYPEGQPKFTEDSLESLPEDAPKEIKLIGTYLMTRSRQALAEQLIGLQDTRGYVHGYVDILGASTHRMASNSPNLQNIPSPIIGKETNAPILGEQGLYGFECRDVFCTDNPRDNILVDADASGIQLRGLAHYGGDTEYIRLVSDPSVDIHKVHADVLSCSRPVAKTFIYALLMGAGTKKLAYVLGSGDPNKGKELLELFYLRFRFLKDLKKRLDFMVKKGYFIALDGRLIRLDTEMPHLAMSVALQSFESIVMKKAAVLYQRTLKDQGIWFIQRLMVHDEFLVETKKAIAEQVGISMVQGIREAGNILGSKCPLDGNYKIGYTWSVCH